MDLGSKTEARVEEGKSSSTKEKEGHSKVREKWKWERVTGKLSSNNVQMVRLKGN